MVVPSQALHISSPQMRLQVPVFRAWSLWSSEHLELGSCSEGLKCPLGQGKMKVQLLLAWGHRSHMSKVRSKSMELKSSCCPSLTEAAELWDVVLLHPFAGGGCCRRSSWWKEICSSAASVRRSFFMSQLALSGQWFSGAFSCVEFGSC